jgi:hypothetical protein
MKHFKIILTLIVLILTVYQVSGQVGTRSKSGKSLSDKEKIEYLIQQVEDLEDASFWRNGIYYDSKTAAAHLRMKLDKAGSRVKTADDFIDRIGSSSSMTGTPYRIRFSDGTEIETKIFFTEQLKKLNGN